MENDHLLLEDWDDLGLAEGTGNGRRPQIVLRKEMGEIVPRGEILLDLVEVRKSGVRILGGILSAYFVKLYLFQNFKHSNITVRKNLNKTM